MIRNHRFPVSSTLCANMPLVTKKLEAPYARLPLPAPLADDTGRNSSLTASGGEGRLQECCATVCRGYVCLPPPPLPSLHLPARTGTSRCPWKCGRDLTGLLKQFDAHFKEVEALLSLETGLAFAAWVAALQWGPLGLKSSPS